MSAKNNRDKSKADQGKQGIQNTLVGVEDKPEVKNNIHQGRQR